MIRINIDIPDKRILDEATTILRAAVREAGLDEFQAVQNPMVRDCALAWRCGDYTREQFIHACKMVAIINPSLKAKP